MGRYSEYFSDFPEEVKKKMLKRQKQHTGKSRFSEFEYNKHSGFRWMDTKEGHEFWRRVIQFKDFNLFFQKYPKKEIITYSGDIKGFPEEVVRKMLKRQKQQTGVMDISVFEAKRYARVGNSGFDWTITPEKFCFWKNVITFEDFDLFFEKYPKKSKNKSLKK